jgi:hypothetical protein
VQHELPQDGPEHVSWHLPAGALHCTFSQALLPLQSMAASAAIAVTVPVHSLPELHRMVQVSLSQRTSF